MDILFLRSYILVSNAARSTCTKPFRHNYAYARNYELCLQNYTKFCKQSSFFNFDAIPWRNDVVPIAWKGTTNLMGSSPCIPVRTKYFYRKSGTAGINCYFYSTIVRRRRITVIDAEAGKNAKTDGVLSLVARNAQTTVRTNTYRDEDELSNNIQASIENLSQKNVRSFCMSIGHGRIDLSNNIWGISLSMTLDKIVPSLLPKDICAIYFMMSAKGLRCRKLQQSLHNRIQQLPQSSFSNSDIKNLLRTLQFCGWRNPKTVTHLALSLKSKLSVSDIPTCREVVVAFARLRIPIDMPEIDELFKKINARFVHLFDYMRTKDVVICLNALVRLERISNSFSSVISSRAPQKFVHRMTPKELALFLNGLARCGQREYGCLEAVEERALEIKEEMKPQDISNILNAFSKLNFTCNSFLTSITPKVQLSINEYIPQHLANIAHACARMNYRNENLFKAIASMTQQSIQQFKACEMVMLAVAVSGLKPCNISLMMCLADELLFRLTVGRHIRRFGTFDLSMIMQMTVSLTKMGLRDPIVFSVLAYQTKLLIRSEVKSDELSTVQPNSGPKKATDLKTSDEKGAKLARAISFLVNSYGTAGVNDRALCGIFERGLQATSSYLNQTGLAAVARGFVPLGIRNSRVLHAIQTQAQKQVSIMPHSSLISFIKSFSMLNVIGKKFIKLALRHLQMNLLDLTPSSIATLISALDRLRYRHPPILLHLARQLISKRSEVSAGELCVSFSSLLKLDFRDHIVLSCLGEVIYAHLHELKQGDIANVLYALVLYPPSRKGHDNFISLQHTENGLDGNYDEQEYGIRDCVDRRTVKHLYFLSHRGKLKGVDDRNIRFSAPWNLIEGLLFQILKFERELLIQSIYSLQIVHLAMRFEHSEYHNLPQRLRYFLQKVSQIPLWSSSAVARSSRLHKAVSRTFSAAGINHTCETQFGPFCLDLVLGHHTCVEVDGPAHYYRNTTMRTASSRLKYRLLELCGWKVYRLPYLEWLQLRTTQLRILYCAQLVGRLNTNKLFGDKSFYGESGNPKH